MNGHLRHLPKLPGEAYRGRIAVHWILGIDRRATGWLNEAFHYRFREMLTHMCVRYHVVVPVYCLMPDHLHLMMQGVRDEADLRLAARFLRKHTAEALFPATYQRQPYDHVLREEELERGAFEGICFYLNENPVRANLCKTGQEYVFTGAVVPGYPDLKVYEKGYWDLFWKICG